MTTATSFLFVIFFAAAIAVARGAYEEEERRANLGNRIDFAGGCKVPVTLVAWLAVGADPEAFARRNGYRAIGPVANLEGVYEFAVACANGGDHAAAAENFEAALARKRDIDPEILKQVVQKKKKHSTRALWDEGPNALPRQEEGEENFASATGYTPKVRVFPPPLK